jgi:uncharacterized hydrophobic protein (TIGR00271 family)
MRQLLVQVPRGQGDHVMGTVRTHRAVNVACYQAQNDRSEPVDIVLFHLSNSQVEDTVQELEDIPELHITFFPHEVIALRPPPSQAAEQVTDLEKRSPVEILLSGLRSIGSWRGLIGYAAGGGIVVWIGMVTNTIFLLIAAMLITPFAGPAMNAALATARGDVRLLARSVVRYCVALAIAIFMSAALTWLIGQSSPTRLMLDVGQVSAVAVLLPLVAGAAGALNIVESENSSLVSGAAAGVLVAASLAPPAGLVGMAAAQGLGDMALRGAFLLMLQLVAINLSGSLVFRAAGVSAEAARYERGQTRVFIASLILAAVALGGLLTWQFSTPINLQRDSLARDLSDDIRQMLEDDPLVHPVEVNARFTHPDLDGRDTFLAVIYAMRLPDSAPTAGEIEDRLQREIRALLNRPELPLVPIVDVTVLDGPAAVVDEAVEE